MNDKLELMLCRLSLIRTQHDIFNVIKKSKSQIIINHMNRIIKEVNESLITVSELIQRIDGDYPKEVEE